MRWVIRCSDCEAFVSIWMAGMEASAFALFLQWYKPLYWLFTRSGISSPPIRCPPHCCQCCRAALDAVASIYWQCLPPLERATSKTCHCCFGPSFFFFFPCLIFRCLPTKTYAFVSLINVKKTVNTLMVRFSETCAMSNGNSEKLHSLQKFWNHIKQIEKLMPPRV